MFSPKVAAVSSPIKSKLSDLDCIQRKINVATTAIAAIGRPLQLAPAKLPIIQNKALWILSSSGAEITMKSVTALKIIDKAIPESNKRVVEIRPPTWPKYNTQITDKSAPI